MTFKLFALLRARRAALLRAAMLLAAAAPAGAERAEISGAPAATDATIYANNPDGNNGLGQTMRAGRTGNGQIRRALFRFDLVGFVPGGSLVTSATLALALTNVPMDAAATSHTLHRVAVSWEEGSGDSDAGEPSPGGVTWNSRRDGISPWLAPGGDFAPAPSAASGASLAEGELMLFSGPGVAVDAQAWVDDPGANFGWIVLGDETIARSVRGFGSAQFPAGPPVLTIEFTPPTALPARSWAAYR